MIATRQTNVDKYLYLSSLKDQNIDLFFRLLIDNVKDLMPLVYTPTIGDVCLQYSTLYTRPEALYISIKQRRSIRTMLRNWPYPNPEICVVTDGSRILGLGDLGINGVGISVSNSYCPVNFPRQQVQLMYFGLLFLPLAALNIRQLTSLVSMTRNFHHLFRNIYFQFLFIYFFFLLQLYLSNNFANKMTSLAI